MTQPFLIVKYKPGKQEYNIIPSGILKIKQQTIRKLRIGPLQKTIPLRLNIPNGCELHSLTLLTRIFLTQSKMRENDTINIAKRL